MDRIRSFIKTKLGSYRKRISIYGDLQRGRASEYDDNQQANRKRKRSHKYLSILSVILLSPAQVLANAVSQSNNGSVTNMAIQSINGNMTTQQFGNNIVCQGATLSFSPFITFGANYRKPFDHYYQTPYYDPTDANDDGVPDNAGDILFYQENYSGTNKDSYAVNTGFSLNFTIPLDRSLQSTCEKAATTQVKLQQQILENKKLDWQIARIRECGTLLANGIRVHKDSPWFNLCADIYIEPKPNQVIPHTHEIDPD